VAPPVIFKNQNTQGWGDFMWYNIHPKLHEGGSTVQMRSHTNKTTFSFKKNTALEGSKIGITVVFVVTCYSVLLSGYCRSTCCVFGHSSNWSLHEQS
jgi:hypothetical protein